MAKKSKKTSRTSAEELKAGAEFMAKVKQLPCMISNRDCRGPVIAHHITSGGRRIDDFHTLPLCDDFHHARDARFGESVHNGTKRFEAKYGTQMEMLEKVKKLIEEGEFYYVEA